MSRPRLRDPARRRPDPPAVVWRCPAGHLLLRVFVDRAGWTVIRQEFRVPLQEWLDRAQSPHTVEDLRQGRAVEADQRRVEAPPKTLPLDISEWPAGRFEIGCRCGPLWADIAALAADCAHARDQRSQVVAQPR